MSIELLLILTMIIITAAFAVLFLTLSRLNEYFSEIMDIQFNGITKMLKIQTEHNTQLAIDIIQRIDRLEEFIKQKEYKSEKL